LGQTEKNSVRAYVFRFALKLGHRSTHSACLKGAKAQERKSAVFHCITLSARERRQSCQPLVCYDQFKSRGGWIGKSPGHNATPRMLRDRNRSREKRLYGPDGRPSARVLIFRKRSGTISESARLVCGPDGGPICHEISRCDCDSCLCRWCWAGGLFCRLAAPRKAVHADGHPIGGPISSVHGSVFASVRWLTARATQNALAALP
jgi:hypothetical protein